MKRFDLYKTSTGKIHLSLKDKGEYMCGMGWDVAKDKEIRVKDGIVTCRTCKNVIKKTIEVYMRVIK